MTAYAYLRKSSVHDPRREVSHEVQEAAVRGMAAQHGDDANLVILSDWDKSGRLGADKRPGYRALLDAIDTGTASAIYSYSLSRLARSVVELSRLIARCDERGVPVRLYADHVDTATASGKLLTHVLSAVAQFEADVASERVRGANAAKLARGESLSTVLFYGDGEGEDAAVVLAAFREAGSYSGAAKLLNTRGVKPRNSKRGWWPSSVNVVVSRLAPEAGRRRERGVRAGGSAFTLARLLRCPTCGTMLTGTRDRGTRIRYSCRLGTALPHPRISVSEHLILPAIRAEIDRLRLPVDAVKMAADSAAERQAIAARLERAHELYVAGAWTRERHAAEVVAATADLSRLSDTEDVAAVSPIRPDEWETWAPGDLNAYLRAIVSAIPLDPVTFQPILPAMWRNPALRS